MKVNGKEIEFKENYRVIDLLHEYNLNEKKVVVEINQEIMEESEFDFYTLKKEDVVEIISFVGGG